MVITGSNVSTRMGPAIELLFHLFSQELCPKSLALYDVEGIKTAVDVESPYLWLDMIDWTTTQEATRVALAANDLMVP